MKTFYVGKSKDSMEYVGSRISAIKAIREITGWGLKASKDYGDMVHDSGLSAIFVTDTPIPVYVQCVEERKMFTGDIVVDTATDIMGRVQTTVEIGTHITIKTITGKIHSFPTKYAETITDAYSSLAENWDLYTTY